MRDGKRHTTGGQRKNHKCAETNLRLVERNTLTYVRLNSLHKV